MSVSRIALFLVKLFLMIVVTAMIMFQIPELRYDFGPEEPVKIESIEDLTLERFGYSTFASVRGTVDLATKTQVSKYGVLFNYFLLEEYGPKLVVRTSEEVDGKWREIELHLGRLRPYERMPFDRTVGATFRQVHDIEIPEDAFSLARDDVPHPGGWTVGAVVFASVLWCVLFYSFFVHGRIVAARKARAKEENFTSEG